MLISYANNTTVCSSVPLTSNREVAASMSRATARTTSSCQLRVIKLNANKRHSITISRARTSDPPHLCLYISGRDLRRLPYALLGCHSLF